MAYCHSTSQTRNEYSLAPKLIKPLLQDCCFAGIEFAVFRVMKPKQNIFKKVIGGPTCAMVVGLLAVMAAFPVSSAGQTNVTRQQKSVLTAFDKHVKDFVKQRNRVKEKLPKLSKDSTPEQIDAHQKSFVDALRLARAGAKPGYVFGSVTDHIRTTIKSEFQGRERVELRETILEADTKGVPLRVNYPYPETKELAQIPPTLLLKLPQLPKEVKYRFVGRHLLLVDNDNGLIVDYMLNALP